MLGLPFTPRKVLLLIVFAVGGSISLHGIVKLWPALTMAKKSVVASTRNTDHHHLNISQAAASSSSQQQQQSVAPPPKLKTKGFNHHRPLQDGYLNMTTDLTAQVARYLYDKLNLMCAGPGNLYEKNNKQLFEYKLKLRKPEPYIPLLAPQGPISDVSNVTLDDMERFVIDKVYHGKANFEEWNRAFVIGQEAWNTLSLAELVLNHSMYFDLKGDDTTANTGALSTTTTTTTERALSSNNNNFPMIAISYGKKIKYVNMRERLVNYWKVPPDRVMGVSFPSVEEVYDNQYYRELVRDHYFTSIENFTSGKELRRKFPPHAILSGMNILMIFEMLANNTFGDETDMILVLEDDAVPVPNFEEKLESILYDQLPSLHSTASMQAGTGWDMVFLGTCGDTLGFPGKPVTRNLHPAARDRCSNGFLITKQCAQKIFTPGLRPKREEYKVIDHWIGQVLISQLDLKVYHVNPPLIYEYTKNPGFLCYYGDNHPNGNSSTTSTTSS